MSEREARPIWLCADDYGISPGVSRAIRELIAGQRLNATSVMTAAPSFRPAEAASLAALKAGRAGVAIGLHVTLTGPFRPMTAGYEPLQNRAFPALPAMLQRALLRRLSPRKIKDEIATQLVRFADAFGHPPDFVDGHQHVQLFPQVRDAFLEAVKEAAPAAWVRQCGRVPMGLARRFADRKALLLDGLSRGFRKRAKRIGLATNPAFAGAYDFTAPEADFASLFARFLEGMPAGGVIMCHPGHVDPELQMLDPLTHQREREYAFFSSEAFPAMLKDRNFTLA